MKIIKLLLLIIPLMVLTDCKDVDDGTIKNHPVHIIFDFSPREGEPGTVVLITGSSFSPVPEENVVEFSGVEGEVVSSNATEIEVKVPQNAATGPISVTINDMTSRTQTEFVVK